MDAAWVEQVLTKAGYNVLETSGGAIVLEDPTCILRSFESFVNFAWAAIGGLALVLLFGWGLAMVRGAKIDIVENIRNLFLLFAGLAMIPALVGFLIGRQVWECKKIVVSMEEVEKLISIEDIDKAARREEETTRREEAARERRERREAAAREKQASSSQPPAEQPTQSARPVQSTKPAVQSTRPTQSAAAKPTTKPAQTASSNARPAAARNTRIGKLSEQFETGGAGPGTINMKSK
ncbi:MAG: hypothetical protein LBQ49_01410, partial [Rickettsiales bacterium]|nr:hypothetical protein [Rickettsiales bacterium]